MRQIFLKENTEGAFWKNERASAKDGCDRRRNYNYFVPEEIDDDQPLTYGRRQTVRKMWPSFLTIVFGTWRLLRSPDFLRLILGDHHSAVYRLTGCEYHIATVYSEIRGRAAGKVVLTKRRFFWMKIVEQVDKLESLGKVQKRLNEHSVGRFWDTTDDAERCQMHSTRQKFGFVVI